MKRFLFADAFQFQKVMTAIRSPPSTDDATVLQLSLQLDTLRQCKA